MKVCKTCNRDSEVVWSVTENCLLCQPKLHGPSKRYVGEPMEMSPKVFPQEGPPPAPEYNGTISFEGIKEAIVNPKLGVELIPPQFIEGLAEVMTWGATTKYSRHNWMCGMKWTAVWAAIMRHLYAFARGEERDPQSGLPHLYHAAFGVMVLAYYAHGPRSDEYRKGDDRVFKGKS